MLKKVAQKSTPTGPNWVQPLKGLALRFVSLEQQGRGPDKTVGFMISIVNVFFKWGLTLW
jgi:hypothetical protein